MVVFYAFIPGSQTSRFLPGAKERKGLLQVPVGNLAPTLYCIPNETILMSDMGKIGANVIQFQRLSSHCVSRRPLGFAHHPSTHPFILIIPPTPTLIQIRSFFLNLSSLSYCVTSILSNSLHGGTERVQRVSERCSRKIYRGALVPSGRLWPCMSLTQSLFLLLGWNFS